MRGCLKIASLVMVLPLLVFAGLALWALRSKLPAEPSLPGKVERGALEHGGRTRTWIAYVSTKPQAHPALVIALHGSMGTAAQARQHYGDDFDLLAEKHGFIAVYPQGYKGHWNDCKLKGPFAGENREHRRRGLPARARRTADYVKDHDADRAHVYVTGVSNGGAMAIRLALETPDFARAYAAVAASVPAPENLALTPKGEPVSMLLMNGTADPFNPWGGGDCVLYGVYGNRGPVLSAQASIDYFPQARRARRSSGQDANSRHRPERWQHRRTPTLDRPRQAQRNADQDSRRWPRPPPSRQTGHAPARQLQPRLPRRERDLGFFSAGPVTNRDLSMPRGRTS